MFYVRVCMDPNSVEEFAVVMVVVIMTDLNTIWPWSLTKPDSTTISSSIATQLKK